jgi:hypothetical protein
MWSIGLHMVTCRPAALEVVAAHYSGGTLLLSEAAGSDGRTTKLLLATRNYTLPLAASTTSAPFGNQGLGGLRELLTELDNFVPGMTCVGWWCLEHRCFSGPGACLFSLLDHSDPVLAHRGDMRNRGGASAQQPWV